MKDKDNRCNSKRKMFKRKWSQAAKDLLKNSTNVDSNSSSASSVNSIGSDEKRKMSSSILEDIAQVGFTNRQIHINSHDKCY